MSTAACPACLTTPQTVERAARAVPNTVLSLPGIHCAACIAAVERVLSSLPGVSDPRVNLTLRRVSAHSELPVDTLVDRLARAGFEAHPLDAAALDPETDPVGRDLALRLGVAGFAMMNVMLLSVAVWSGAADATRDLFHLISAAISLPVVAYAAQPFFRPALGALTGGRLNMDVPISLAILLAAGMSLFEALNGGHHAYFDAALSLTFFLLIGRYLDHRTRASARSAARELAALEVFTAERLTGTKTETVPLSRLVVGDRILVPTGARIPVDGTLPDAGAVTDRSFLTGESDPVTSAPGEELRAGEINLGAPLRLEATAVGEDTTLRRIARLVETAENARNRYTSLADKAARIYAPAVHLLAFAAFCGWWVTTGDLRLALNVATAVLIITCPCALGLAVPAVSTAAIGKLYHLGFLVKSGTALERLAEARRVVFDKTGTLTLPCPAPHIGQLDREQRAIAKGLAQASQHPVSRALADLLHDVPPESVEDVTEIPGQGLEGAVRGTPVRLGRASFAGGTGNGLALRIGDTCMDLGHRETLRPGAENAVRALQKAGLETSVLSGDSPAHVRKVARELGMPEFVSGMSPEEKHREINELEKSGIRVAMTGDGLNDTAALSAAHVSIAPSTALDATRNAADIVLLRDSLDNMPRLFAIAHKAGRLSRQNFAIAAGYNCIAIPVALAGYATPLLAALAMSASSLTVLANALRVRIAK